MVGGAFKRFIGIDWSGAAKRSGQQVYVAEAHRHQGRTTLHSVVRARDRQAVEGWLAGEPLEHAPEWRDWPGPGPIDHRARRVVALDFAFGFPAAFEHPESDGAWTWADLARWAAALEDGNGSNGGALASVRNAIEHDPALARQFRLGAGSEAVMHPRKCDELAHGATSVFHLIGPSQVGLGSITGIAMLHRLREHPNVAIWPFDPPERIHAADAVLVEAFPRMWLQDGLKKNELPARVRQLEAWEHDGVSFRTDAERAAISSGDALDAAAAAVGAARYWERLPPADELPEEAREREGWIVGVPAA
jgi:hypothetical protein